MTHILSGRAVWERGGSVKTRTVPNPNQTTRREIFVLGSRKNEELCRNPAEIIKRPCWGKTVTQIKQVYSNAAVLHLNLYPPFCTLMQHLAFICLTSVDGGEQTLSAWCCGVFTPKFTNCAPSRQTLKKGCLLVCSYRITAHLQSWQRNWKPPVKQPHSDILVHSSPKGPLTRRATAQLFNYQSAGKLCRAILVLLCFNPYISGMWSSDEQNIKMCSSSYWRLQTETYQSDNKAV